LRKAKGGEGNQLLQFALKKVRKDHREEKLIAVTAPPGGQQKNFKTIQEGEDQGWAGTKIMGKITGEIGKGGGIS